MAWNVLVGAARISNRGQRRSGGQRRAATYLDAAIRFAADDIRYALLRRQISIDSGLIRREPADVLREIKKSMGTMLFSAQYQQSPEPAGGKIIKRKMLRYYSAVVQKPTDRIVLSWDIALSDYRFISASNRGSVPGGTASMSTEPADSPLKACRHLCGAASSDFQRVERDQ